MGEPSQSGCGWLIQMDNKSDIVNSLLLPINIVQNYQEKGLRVEITYRPNDIVYECINNGNSYLIMKDIHVLNIKRL